MALFFHIGIMTVAGTVLAATASKSCASAEDVACRLAELAVLADDEAVVLLQKSKGKVTNWDGKIGKGEEMIQHTVKQTPLEAELLFHLVKAAVQSDKFKEEMARAKNTSQGKALEAKLEKLHKEYPDAEAVKQHFHAQWAQIKETVEYQDVQEKLKKAEAAGGDAVPALKEKLQKLQAHLPENPVEAMHKETAEVWGRLKAKGVSLPNLANAKAAMEAKLEATRGAAKQKVKDAEAKLEATKGAAKQNVKDAEAKLEATKGAAKQNVKDAAQNVKDAASSLKDAFGDIW